MVGGKLVSWNVNGIRAISQKGFIPWVQEVKPDLLCLQETKAHPDQLSADLLDIPGYGVVWRSAEKKGYSGVATYFKKEPLSEMDLGIEEFDSEGRVQILEYPLFTLINAYFPNSQAERARLDYKLRFNEAILKKCDELVADGKHVIVCGDFNVAHKEIDLTHPKANEDSPGYYIEERQWMDAFVEAGYVDTFRAFCQDPEQYSWWSYRAAARKRNVGWRIDYHCVNKDFMGRVKHAEIWQDVMGSDHCPVVLELKK